MTLGADYPFCEVKISQKQPTPVSFTGGWSRLVKSCPQLVENWPKLVGELASTS